MQMVDELLAEDQGISRNIVECKFEKKGMDDSQITV